MTTTSSLTVEECASYIMDTVPLLMRTVGSAMNQQHVPDLSLPQFRALIIIQRNEGASLTLVAEHLGSTLSAASKLIDGLVERQLLTRTTVPEDRRRMTLVLTQQGTAVLEAMWQVGLRFIVERLTAIPLDECQELTAAIRRLHEVFTQPRTAE